MRVLVCGGRDFDDPFLLAARLAELGPFSMLIHGDARGADTLADNWARYMGVPVIRFPADWRKHGAYAGPIRNRQMLVEGKPDLVVAFPGGKGTANMVALAREACVEVVEVKEDGP